MKNLIIRRCDKLLMNLCVYKQDVSEVKQIIAKAFNLMLLHYKGQTFNNVDLISKINLELNRHNVFYFEMEEGEIYDI